MKPSYFADEHFNKAALKQLTLRGLDALHAEEAGFAGWQDFQLLEYATQQGRVMLTCDRDFEDLHYEWLEQEKPHSGIILMHPDHHCKHPGEIVRIVMYYHELADTAEDMQNRLWPGEDAE